MTETRILMSRLRLFKKTLPARFLSRPNRFLVRCEWQDQTISAFLPNPGRLQELLLPGRLIYLIEEKKFEHRKTRYTAVAVERDGYPVMLHTFGNNEVARYLLQKRRIPGLEKARIVKSEVPVGKSRFDFLLEDGDKDILLEVKSCTLVGEEVAMFPDAVTERGTRHLKELVRLSEEGIKTVILFIVHWPFASVFMPDYHTNLEFFRTLLNIRNRVNVVPVSVHWNQDLSLSPKVRLLQIPWDYIEEEASKKKKRGRFCFIDKSELN